METDASGFDGDLEAQTCQGKISSTRDLSSPAEIKDSHEPDPENSSAIGKQRSFQPIPEGKLTTSIQELLGVRGLAAYETEDLTKMTRRAFIEVGNYCQITQQQDIERLWGGLKEAIASKSPHQAQLTKDTHEELRRYWKSILLERQISALNQPDRISLENYLETAHGKLSRGPAQERKFLVNNKDWIMTFYMEAFESSLNQVIMNYRFGRLLLTPSRWKRQQDETRTYVFYGRDVIQGLLYGVFIGLVGAFLGIPVVISTMDVTTNAEQAAIYVVFLIVFGLLAKALLKGFNLPLIAILAYAAVLCGGSVRNG